MTQATPDEPSIQDAAELFAAFDSEAGEDNEEE